MNILSVFVSLQRSKSLCIRNIKKYDFIPLCCHKSSSTSSYFSSKKVRQLFLDFFMKEKNHIYVHSSSVFLNNDPTLLFVNAGMNQFRSLLLEKLSPTHPFSKLKRAANSQKCIRLSGKHNDLDNVGQDLHHHTFFEMLGNWSFGDYSKKEACKMAWELLTNVYNLNPDNLYVTYFGGCRILGLPADEECKSIWLSIGIKPDHIFPFVKENFWEMADVGPCGPCTEIHYDFLSSNPESAANRINADKPDLIELWNLVFIQYNREKNGSLTPIPHLNIDTGMGFERLTAVLQGTMSNYDTDVFIPIFKAIEKNFNVRPYTGKIGSYDTDGIDTAYRILADHSRMFSVSIADGLFPDSFDAGHVLRKIIRRGSYAANKVLKSRPGVLSSLVPVVAETLDFFPEINNNVKEIVDVVNEEEKLFHQIVNRGRKTRNNMMSENNSNKLSGMQAWQLRENYGLEEAVLKDLTSEVNLTIDWKDYEKICIEKKINEKNQFKEEEDYFSTIIKKLQDLNVHETNDSFKYNYSSNQNKYGVKEITATVLGVVMNKSFVTEAVEGNQCFIITDATNFYCEAGGQITDIGKIYNKDFTFKVDAVFSSKGYVFHRGNIVNGNLSNGCKVKMYVDQEQRLACSLNHTATHLLNSVLRRILPYTCQRSSYVGPTNLRFGFSSKSPLTLDQIEEIERSVNEIIQKKFNVNRTVMQFQELLDNSSAIILRGEEYPDTVSVISVTTESDEILSLEPCCGTHVHNTYDLGQFVIIPSKSHGGSTRILSAVTGKQASLINKNGEAVIAKVSELKMKVDNISEMSEELLSALLKEVKQTLRECQLMQNAPLITLKKCEKLLDDLKLKLNDMLSSRNNAETMNLDISADSGKTKCSISEDVIHLLLSNNIPVTYDDLKYKWNVKDSKPIEAEILAIIRDNELVSSVNRGFNCQIILDKTNFYAEEDDQACDIGIISSEDFVFKVSNVYKVDGLVFHDGYVEEGCITSKKTVKSMINEKHRLACSQNHTTLHLLNAVLKEELQYSYQLFAHAGSKDLSLSFSSKSSLSDEQLQNIERKVNEAIQNNFNVLKSQTLVESSNQFPAYKLPIIKKSKDSVPVISIGEDNESPMKSVEPCYGTHVSSTADIGSFVITSSKSKSSKEKTIRAVTGYTAEIVKREGHMYETEMLELENYASSCLEKENLDFLELWDCLKEIKLAKANHDTELPILLFRKHQNVLSELSKKLTAATNDFVQEGFKMVASEMQMVLKDNCDKPYIIYNLKSVGDGKKIINYAIDNSLDKPTIYFVQDGHKSIICSCHVPKHMVHSSFSALLWINPVASFLEGKARTLSKDPQLFYSVVCPKRENLDNAINIAKLFIESNMNVNKSQFSCQNHL